MSNTLPWIAIFLGAASCAQGPAVSRELRAPAALSVNLGIAAPGETSNDRSEPLSNDAAFPGESSWSPSSLFDVRAGRVLELTTWQVSCYGPSGSTRLRLKYQEASPVGDQEAGYIAEAWRREGGESGDTYLGKIPGTLSILHALDEELHYMRRPYGQTQSSSPRGVTLRWFEDDELVLEENLKGLPIFGPFDPARTGIAFYIADLIEKHASLQTK